MPANLVTSEFALSLQRILDPAYRLERELEGGGMSRVFLASDTRLGRQVVVKALPPELASRASAARFQREIAVTVQLEHPHIIPIITAGAHDELLYYITPYIAGETLQERIAKAGRLSFKEAMPLLAEIADAIGFAHARGIVHRDLKPANILLAHGHVRIADFGIARALDEAAVKRLTRPGSGVGTTGYMPPEQLAGADVDARADVYALAVVAYEMLTGELPAAQVPEQGRRRRSQSQVKLPADVPDETWFAISRGLAAHAEDRFANATEFGKAIIQRPKKRLWRVAAVGVATLALIVAALFFGDRLPLLSPAPVAGLDSNMVVVVPFDVIGADPAFARAVPGGLVSFLDGAGPLRAMWMRPSSAPNGGGAITSAELASLAVSAKARYAISGHVSGVGKDSLRVLIDLVDARRGQTIAPIEARSSIDGAGRLTDSLTVRILGRIGEYQPVGAVRAAPLASGSMSALWWYLRGERFLRENNRDSAAAAYVEAQRIDSTSPIGLRRLRTILRGLRSEWDSTSMAYAVRAGALNHGLGPRDSMLVLADSLYGAIIREPYSAQRVARVRRWHAVLDAASRAYPFDAETQYERGEARFHLGDVVGMPEDSALASFEAAIRLDPGYASPYFHAVQLAVRHRTADSAAVLVRRYLRIKPQDATYQLALTLLTHPPDNAPAAGMAAALSFTDVRRAAYLLEFWSDPHGLYRSLLVRAMDEARKSNVPGTVERQAPVLMELAALHGWLGLARDFSSSMVADSVPHEYAALANASPGMNTAAAEKFAEWLSKGDVFRVAHATSWWYAQRDAASLERARRLADARNAATDGDPRSASMAQYLAQSSRAYIEALTGDAERAIDRFAALPDSLCAGLCVADQLTRATLLTLRHRGAQAAQVLDAHRPSLSYPSILEIAWHRSRARAAEAMADSTTARLQDGIVAQLWRTADSPLSVESRGTRGVSSTLP